MCCIFGIGFLKGHKMKNKDLAIGLISVLAKEAQTGGRSATGISIMRETSAHVIKRPVMADVLVRSDEYQQLLENNLVFENSENLTTSVIGHCRYPTKGSESNNLNNHPLIVNHIIGVHNGMISNDDALFKGFKSQFNRLGEVDTEIIFQLIAHFCKKRQINTIDAIEKTTSYLRGGYACAMQNANHPYHLYLFRSGNPIRIMIMKDLGLVMFATREYFMERALDMMDKEPETEEMELVSETGISFNLNDRSFTKFVFPRVI